MKRITEAFTDEEFERLKFAKGNKSWHDFIMQLASHVELHPSPAGLSLWSWLKIYKGLTKTEYFKMYEERRKDLRDEWLAEVKKALAQKYGGLEEKLDVRSLSPRNWLKIYKGLTWGEFLKLHDQKRKELLDEYAAEVKKEETASRLKQKAEEALRDLEKGEKLEKELEKLKKS